MSVGARPLVSIVVVSYDMERELPRTLHTLSAPYQVGLESDAVEVIVVDNGSKTPPDPASLPAGFRLLHVDDPTSSPVRAMNIGLRAARSNLIGAMIDGARMASPGLCKFALLASKLHDRPIISTLGFHRGPEVQMKSVKRGYCQAEEDRLLESIDWKRDGYDLFSVSVFAGSCKQGWFLPMAESNALFLTREMWNELDGYDENFVAPGGGLANLDTYVRACGLAETELITLLGEGTFHQVHGGIATNQEDPRASWDVFHEEYIGIRGKAFSVPDKRPVFLGTIRPQVLDSIRRSGEFLPYRPLRG